ncbi:MAG: hypothetical protein HOV94_09285 [Saccharothrix sp.]|nr:hypothetical protein [Saccharothrix sp.]
MDTRSTTARLARRAFPWRNPLAGLGDRIEGAVAVASVAATLLGLPSAAAIGSEVYAAQSALSDEQLRARHPVEAVLSVDAPSSAGGVTAIDTAVVPAVWRLPDGTSRSGPVAARHDLPAGSAVRIWLDDTGSPVLPPLTAESAVVLAAAVAMGSWIALGGAMACGYVLVRSAHTRIRRRLWETEWAAVEPGWRKLV